VWDELYGVYLEAGVETAAGLVEREGLVRGLDVAVGRAGRLSVILCHPTETLRRVVGAVLWGLRQGEVREVRVVAPTGRELREALRGIPAEEAASFLRWGVGMENDVVVVELEGDVAYVLRPAGAAERAAYAAAGRLVRQGARRAVVIPARDLPGMVLAFDRLDF